MDDIRFLLVVGDQSNAWIGQIASKKSLPAISFISNFSPQSSAYVLFSINIEHFSSKTSNLVLILSNTYIDDALITRIGYGANCRLGAEKDIVGSLFWLIEASRMYKVVSAAVVLYRLFSIICNAGIISEKLGYIHTSRLVAD